MMKIVIKTCSCFIDLAVWFMNLADIPPYWYYNWTINHSYENRRSELLKKHFIKEVRTTKTVLEDDDDYELTKITIVKSCFDCFKFQVYLSTVTNVLNDLNCRFVTSDMTTFSDDFNSDIFVGNSQFVVENTFYSEEEKKLLFNGEEIDFINRPLHKSCFVSLQKKRY